MPSCTGSEAKVRINLITACCSTNEEIVNCKYLIICYLQGFSGMIYNASLGTLPDYLWCSLQPRACLHGGGGPQVGEVTLFGGVTHLSI